MPKLTDAQKQKFWEAFEAIEDLAHSPTTWPLFEHTTDPDLSPLLVNLYCSLGGISKVLGIPGWNE